MQDFLYYISTLWKTWLQFSVEALKSNMELGEKSKESFKMPIKTIPNKGSSPNFNDVNLS